MDQNNTPMENTKLESLNSKNTVFSNSNMAYLFHHIETTMETVQLPYYKYLYFGCEETDKLYIYEQDMIETLGNKSYQTEFEPEISKRSFFKVLREKITTGESILLISVALPYPRQVEGLSRSVGIIDASSWYYDYHTVLKERMERAQGIFSKMERISLKESQCFVDTSDYIDRDLAFLCGLGTYGKNHMLIHPELGTQFHIGHLVMVFKDEIKPYFSKIRSKIELESQRVYEGCKNCKQCVLACPAGICGTVDMNRQRCVSYLTQTKRPLTVEEMRTMGNKLYGCDICQKVCPANKTQKENAYKTNSTSHWKLNDFVGVDLLGIFNLSQRAFKRQYGELGFAWRGVKILKRNALISIGNSDDTELIKEFKELSMQLEELSILKEDPFFKPYYEYALKGKRTI